MRITLLLAAVLPVFAHDWLIVPGERVGPIAATSTEASLKAAFGGDAVLPAQIRIDKKTTAPGVEVYRGRSGESLAVVWPRKDGTLRWPLLVIPCYGSVGKKCRWRTAAGVGIGTTIEELEKLNEKPFLFYRPDDDSWTDLLWEGGKLAAQLGEDVELSFDDPNRQVRVHGPGDASGYPRSDEVVAGRDLPVSRMFVFLLSPRRTPPANDWTIVLGERFGPIPMGAEAEPLRETLGPDSVHRDMMDMGEGFFEPAISVFGGDVKRKVLLNKIAKEICGREYKGCKWHIAGGLPLSTTVEAMERLNGRPFKFAGFAWDGSGVVESWEGGRMPGHSLLGFRVQCEGDPPERLTGDGVQIRSDDPDIRKLKCTVGVDSFAQR